MSAEVVKGAAMHHHPLRAGDRAFTALTAVHVANALEYEGSPDADGLCASVLDTSYLQQLGLEARVQLWRDARREQDAALFDTRFLRKNAAKAAAKSPQPAPAPAAQSIKFSPAQLPPPSSLFRELGKWLGLGLGVSAVLALLSWLEIMRLESRAEIPVIHMAMQTPAKTVKHELAKAAAAAQPVEKAPVKAVEVLKPAPAQPTHVEPMLAAQPASTPAQAPTPTRTPPPVPAKLGFDRLKLEAIFFSSQHPSALINGQLASVDQVVADCRVMDIGPSSVTLEYQHQRKTLVIR
jgi:hypothetical protein